MAEILQDPLKVKMLIVLLALEIPAALLLVKWWKEARKA